ncbi:hypothetical protein [Paenibacillus tundrae]|uniref:hypothetical protein n=1 Tax=Paenibacillus tundrae TaxID=528187 RepID=UPI0022A949AD|nr:hypothetical protein [Paenibacillus tundrae]MCZ1268900.1 hypothetical protein [Paenibacillus tundrae]
MDEIKQRWKYVFSFISNSGLLLAGITALVYIIPYAYEKGHKHYYGIHEEFIELNLPQIFSTNISVFFVEIAFVLILVISTLIVWSIVLIVNRYILEKFFSKKLIEKGDFKGFWRAFFSIGLIVAIISSYHFALNLGKTEAQIQQEYWTVKEDGTNFVIVDAYREYFIIMPLKEGKIIQEYKFVKPETLQSNIILSYFRSGLEIKLNTIKQ